jgi:hypothetical protein
MPQLDSQGVFRIDMDDGWNIIGNPFELPVSADAIRILNSDTSAVFHTFLGSQGFASSDSLLNPFVGYYYYNDTGLDSLSIPYPFPGIGPESIQRPSIAWSLQLILEVGQDRDSRNFVGAAGSAHWGDDLLDEQKPPYLSGRPFLGFARAGVEGFSGLLGSDFRPMDGEGQSWRVVINNPNLSDAKISAVGIGDIPGGAGVVLLNILANERVDLREHPEYSYHTLRESMEFLLIVGSDAFVDREIAGTVPREFELSQNYPNPFNPETSISVGIPRSSDVVVEVLSVLGQRVALIADGVLEPGTYTFRWNGRNHSGGIVSTGVYFYRLVVDGSPLTYRKMILLR